ncbi:MAG: OsmC family protein [Rhodospirillales bacterium]|jgi:putative redox protein|nr:OsmC family protein [Rhodospirillales bacterium]MDP6644689.1 OsmC family protein [Rhodospirillales bacterium]|tara:strand:+ start:1701 stop:2132 length:432 start_codon:yes stop_codon:yes gene_type:complete
MAATKTRVKWVEQRTFLGSTGSGHSVVMGGAAADGGRDQGVRPMEMLLLGLGGCTAYDVVDILQKSREPVEDVAIEIEGERADDIPKVFTDIRVRYIVSGRGLDPAKVERAVKLSADKYCSATVMLGATAKISHEIEIIDSGS